MNGSRRWLTVLAYFLFVVVVVVEVAVIVGVGLFLWGDIHAARSEWGAVAGQRIGTVALPTLRCMNGSSPKLWTRVEAEAKIHLVQVALDTALANSWNPKFRDWTEFAKANMELVKVCWGGTR